MSFFKKIRDMINHSVRLEVRQLSESLMQQGTALLIAL